MPDEKGNLIPGDPGYVAPVETPETTTTEQQGSVNNPTDSVVETQPSETTTPETPIETSTDSVPVEEASVSEPSLTSSQAVGQHLAGVRNYEPSELTQEKYDLLLAVYTKLKNRVGLDPSLEKQLDTEAGLY